MEFLHNNLNLTQQLTYELGVAIVQGKYPVDATFPTEAELSAQFQISRSVTREAVKMLTAKGLISSRPRKGIRVLPPSSWNMFDGDVLNWTLEAKPTLQMMREFTQLRVAIEPEAVALACANASREQISRIESALERILLADQGNDNRLEAEIDFHTAVLKASKNVFFIQLCGFIRAALRVNKACSEDYAEIRGPLPDIYRSLFFNIQQGNRDAAQNLMRELLDDTMRRMKMATNRLQAEQAQLDETAVDA